MKTNLISKWTGSNETGAKRCGRRLLGNEDTITTAEQIIARAFACVPVRVRAFSRKITKPALQNISALRVVTFKRWPTRDAGVTNKISIRRDLAKRILMAATRYQRFSIIAQNVDGFIYFLIILLRGGLLETISFFQLFFHWPH